MAEELGTKDVLGQLDARLGNVETDVRDLRAEMRSGFDRVQQSFNDFNIRFESQTRWLVGLILASWLTIMASLWLKH